MSKLILAENGHVWYKACQCDFCVNCRESSCSAEEVCPGARPIPMVMYCPAGHQHVDDEAWAARPHRTHQCQEVLGTVNGARKCGLEWRPMDASTVGVEKI